MCVFQSKFGQQMNENHMASHLVRWWKTKFLNGYKQFTAVLPTDCSDGRPSDTEELLRPDSEEFVAQPNHHHHHQQQQRLSHSTPPSSAPPPTTKPHSINNNNHHHHHRTPSSTPPPSGKRELNFEEFQCDVSVEGTGSGSGEPNDRQEFSFTLYDFDGHGKITKDDIAGLVTTIYDTLGSSIRVPHYGSKTIKVKLTVSPDQIHNTATAADKTSPPTTEEGGGNGVPASQQATPPPQQQPPPPRRFKRDLNVTIRERRRRHPPPPHHHHHHHPTPHAAARRRHSFSSSAPSEDREADISEDDDDVVGHQQNQQQQQQTPLPPSAHSRLGVPPHSHINSSRLGHPGTLPTSACCGRSKKRSSSLQRQELLQIIQANMEKNNLCFQTSRKPYSVGQENERHKMSHHNHYWEKGGATTRGQSRNRVKSSHDIPPVIPPRPVPTSPTQAPPPPPGPAAASSPHHLKHRHREQEQARAMAQVVRWLEQEFSTPHREKTHHKTTSTERTEHHHIHEHVHHHYHHYQDTPVLV